MTSCKTKKAAFYFGLKLSCQQIKPQTYILQHIFKIYTLSGVVCDASVGLLFSCHLTLHS